jgi:hypothetical protein
MTVRFRNSITNVHVPRFKNKHSAAFVFGRAMVKNPHKKIHKNSHAILRNIQASITMMMMMMTCRGKDGSFMIDLEIDHFYGDKGSFKRGEKSQGKISHFKHKLLHNEISLEK